jgi:formyl-CoA transferase
MRNKQVLIELLEEMFQKEPADYWLRKLEEFGVPCGPILTFHESLTDPHVLERNMVLDMEHPSAGTVKVLRMGAKLHDTPEVVLKPAPRLGEHTEEILREVGLSDEAIEDLLIRGIVKKMDAEGDGR